MSAPEASWHRIENKIAFVAAIADRPLKGDGLRFQIHADGKISGQVGTETLAGEWHWENGFFCRTAWLEGESLGLDCEIIEIRGAEMRYTRNMGRGDASVVTIGPR
ncbi:hypothetical protein MUY35_03630 [Aliiroseovarius sp. S1339]|uniref:hypothetical protein n=1 Tax=Aliiroseovarius sp. S1339 TaxID=2936990 RepID=UPI0020BE6384|nr:hypothetical protein [Aliiroseovarius sp. S1339]MCK8462937.1 hypothetical protein [Aliiroseovarius sp. S1339]